MIESKIHPENSTIVEPTSITTVTTPTTTSNPKNEDDARKSVKKLAACHRQFYRRLSHVVASTSSTYTAATTTNSGDTNTNIMAATSSDKKSSAQESCEALSNSDDQLNDPPPPPPTPPPSVRTSSSSSFSSTSSSSSSLSSSASSYSVAELNDSGRVIDDVETTPLSNNVIRVLNSSADVSNGLPTESPSPIMTVAARVSMETMESYQGCGEDEATIRSKPPVTAANLIGKTNDVSSNTGEGSDFPTNTTTNVTFGSRVDCICCSSKGDGDGNGEGGGSGFTDVHNDKRNKKNTTTTVQPQCELLLPPPPVSNQNKWTGTEEPNVSCHSTCETSTSLLSSSSSSNTYDRKPQSRSCLSFPAAISCSSSSSTLSVRRSLVEERKRDLLERSQQDTRARSRSRSPIAEDLERNSANFPSVNRLVKMYTKILQDNKQPAVTVKDISSNLAEDLEKKMSLKVDEDQLKPSIDPHRNSPLSDEGCTLGQSPYSSDCDEEQDDTESVKPAKKKKEKVARSASSDSALGLDEEPMEPPANLNQGRRMTLTVTDLPLRPALLPLAEPNNLPDSPTAEVQISLNALLTQTAIPSKVLLEERVVEIPEDRYGSLSSSRRESAQSCMSDYQNSECGGVRFVRTPSVVVSDYSDDLMCGITLEEIEYFRAQRLRRRSSVETSGTEKDDAASDVSASSSCSNLYYCGSTISALDGAECFVNGVRMPIDRKISDCSTCEGSGDEDSQSFVIPEQPEDLKEYISYCTEQMVAQQQQQQQKLANRKPKKVGGSTNTDTCNTNSNYSES